MPDVYPIQQGADYGPDGLYVHGPQMARPPLVRLMGETICPFTGGDPAKARYETVTRPRLMARRRLRAAMSGALTGRRNRSRAA